MGKVDISDFFSQLEWDENVEELLASWADIAACYTWLYDHAYRRYDRINLSFSLPIFILSTVTGTLVMSLGSVLGQNDVSKAQFALGAVNIFTGILSSIQNNYKFSGLAEANLNASRDWSKFERNIKIQLTLNKESRKNVEEFCKDCREEYERLLDISPVINSSSIQSFKKTFTDSDLTKPEILDKIEKTLSNSKNKVLDDLLTLKSKKEEENSIKIEENFRETSKKVIDVSKVLKEQEEDSKFNIHIENV